MIYQVLTFHRCLAHCFWLILFLRRPVSLSKEGRQEVAIPNLWQQCYICCGASFCLTLRHFTTSLFSGLCTCVVLVNWAKTVTVTLHVDIPSTCVLSGIHFAHPTALSITMYYDSCLPRSHEYVYYLTAIAKYVLRPTLCIPRSIIYCISKSLSSNPLLSTETCRFHRVFPKHLSLLLWPSLASTRYSHLVEASRDCKKYLVWFCFKCKTTEMSREPEFWVTGKKRKYDNITMSVALSVVHTPHSILELFMFSD